MSEFQSDMKIKGTSRFSQVVDQFRQWRKEGTYFDDYLLNCAKIILGYRPIDYRVISHENALVHSLFEEPTYR